MEYFARVLVWIFTIFSIVNSFKLASLLQPVRDFLAYSKVLKRDERGIVTEAMARKNQFLYRLINCPMCFSWHIGWIFSLLIWSPTGYNVFWLFRIGCDAFLASITSWLLFVYTSPKQYGTK